MLPVPRPEDASPDDPATIEALTIALAALGAEAKDARYDEPRFRLLRRWLGFFAALADERGRHSR